jgi:hypothetical protein
MATTSSTGPARALRLIAFVYMVASIGVALLSLAGGGGTTGTVLTSLLVAGQGVLLWAFCAVVAAIADDLHALIVSQ